MSDITEISKLLREHDKLAADIAYLKKRMEDISVSLGMNKENAKNHIASSGFLRGWIIAARNNQ